MVPWSAFQVARYSSAASFDGAVRRDGPTRVVLARRALHVAVDRAAGRAEDDLRAVAARRLEHVERSEHVHLCIEDRPLDGRADVRLRCEMKDDLRHDPAEDRDERFADVVLVHRRRGVQILAAGR